jgi:hypothetical protein
MTKFVGALGVAASLLLLPTTSVHAEDGIRLRPMLGLGYGFGGDTILPVTIVPQGTSIEYEETIKAGTGIDLRAGLEVAFPRTPFALQMAVAYQNDGAAGLDNKHIDFRRVPVELIGYWRVAPQVRLGVGVRKTTHADLRNSNSYCKQSKTEVSSSTLPCSYSFKSTVGAILEAEYELTPSWGLRARYVVETFKLKDESLSDEKYRGDHLGILSVWYLR